MFPSPESGIINSFAAQVAAETQSPGFRPLSRGLSIPSKMAENTLRKYISFRPLSRGLSIPSAPAVLYSYGAGRFPSPESGIINSFSYVNALVRRGY